MTRNIKPMLIGLSVAFALILVGTAIAGQRGAVERETLIRARVWCDALIDREPLRYQETFRRGYFRGRFDRFANLYREASEASILKQMPVTTDCGVAGPIRISDAEMEVFVPVIRTGPAGESTRLELRMRKEAGFWVVGQLVEPQLAEQK